MTQMIIITQQSQQNALTRIANLPTDGSVEIVIQPKTEARSQSQNAKQWADVLAQISSQAWVQGKQFSPEVWHDYLKRMFLPESYDPELTRDGYIKWADLPDGSLKCVGSTTKLTKKGFSQYMTQVEVYAIQELGVIFYVQDRK
jgi:hypothetical protein